MWVLEAQHHSSPEWHHMANPIVSGDGEIEALIRYWRTIRQALNGPRKFLHRLHNLETGEVIPTEILADDV